MKSLLELLLTEKDERDFSSLLRTSFPNIRFAEESPGSAERLTVWDSIDRMKTKYGYVWNLPEDLVGSHEVDISRIHVLRRGVSVHLIRSVRTGYELQAGHLGAGVFNDYPAYEEMVAFIKSVWKIAKKFGKARVNYVDDLTYQVTNPGGPSFIVGPDAIAWCTAEEGRYFRNESGNCYLLPAANPPEKKAGR